MNVPSPAGTPLRLPADAARFLRRKAWLIGLGIILLAAGCGPEDYQKPVQQFQDASSVVIASTSTMLKNANTVEQELQVDRLAFQKQPINPAEIDKVQIISPESIRIRIAALETLAAFIANLANLASGKAHTAIADETKNLSDTLKVLAGDAQKLPVAPDVLLDNAKFSGMASAAASAMGALADLIVQHYSRRQLEAAILKTEPPITALMELIAQDAEAAYLRQKSSLGERGIELYRRYEEARKLNVDPTVTMTLANAIKSYRKEKALLADANPRPAIDKMRDAYRSLIHYAKSDKKPQDLDQLVTAVKAFAAAAEPLGEAGSALYKAF
jgi:hypothetical protein